MPYRKTPFADGQYYHTTTRGVEKRPVFSSTRDYRRLLDMLNFYRFGTLPIRYSHYNRLPRETKTNFEKNLYKNTSPVVEIAAFCLMPNHLHFLVRQKQENGVKIFMGNLLNSYGKYFNTKYDRVGPLFQPMFKAVLIETDAQLWHVSRYIHLNPVSAHLIETSDLKSYLWSSFPCYLETTNYPFVSKKLIRNHFGKGKNYEEFVYNQADHQRRLQDIKHLILEK